MNHRNDFLVVDWEWRVWPFANAADARSRVRDPEQ